MGRIVVVFGLISGVIISVTMAVTVAFIDVVGFDRGEIIGYSTMIAAFLLIFFGVRSYRDNVGGGSVSFGRAFAVGALITVVASVLYVASWQVVYHGFASDFPDKYQAYMTERIRAKGGTQAEIERKLADAARFSEWYRKPAIRAAVTFLEPLPVGLVIALVSAGILRRRRPVPEAGPMT